MRKIMVVLLLVLFPAMNVLANDETKATPQDVYTLVLKGYEVIKNLGENGLVAFNDPKGEFVYKDTYVYVMKCPSEMAAHPFAMEQLKGVDLRKYSHTDPSCQLAKNPKGGWVEYTWPKPGETTPSRKVAFVLGVEGTSYAIVAGIFDDSTSIEELNKNLR
jgi:hypothetical protein